MSNVRPFQVVLIAVFGLLGLIAIIFLTTYQAKKSVQETAYGDSVEIWGTLSQDVVKTTLQEVSRTDKAFSVVEYRQFDKESFIGDLVNAIAEGRSPDLVVLESSTLVTLRPKLFPIPYDTLTKRDYKTAYVDGADIFGLAEGFYGIPFAVDPLVMYWNRGLFAANSLAQAPTTWEQVTNVSVPSLTIRDSQHNILQSGVSFSGYSNVAHAKSLLMTLAWQLGSQMVRENENGYTVGLDDPVEGAPTSPFSNLVDFYTSFGSDANSNRYSWNKALPKDTDAFASGDLAIYFGPGSEYVDLENKNPNLDFDMAPVPQGDGATVLYTYGDFYAFAIPKAAKNPQASFAVAKVLASKAPAEAIAKGLNMAPVRRDSIAQGDSNFYREIILSSALIARGWLDPNPIESDGIFTEMVEDILGNSSRLSDAVADAIDRLIIAF